VRLSDWHSRGKRQEKKLESGKWKVEKGVNLSGETTGSGLNYLLPSIRKLMMLIIFIPE